jgi:hypothetical protein
MRIAILADLAEPVGLEARSLNAVLAFEMASAFQRAAREAGGISADLVARRGSWRGLPLLSLDPDEVPSSHPQVSQEALYTQLVLAGMLQEYDAIHCLAPLIAPVQILLSRGAAVLQTLTVSRSDPRAEIVPVLARGARWRRSVLTPSDDPGSVSIAPCIDLERFVFPDARHPEYVLCLGGSSGESRHARAVAGQLGLPLRTKVEPADQALQQARVFLDLSPHPGPIPSLWALRALACGVPVAGWERGSLAAVVRSPEIGALAPAGECEQLAGRIRQIPDFGVAATLRRQLVLRQFSRRQMVAQLLIEYRSLLGLP